MPFGINDIWGSGLISQAGQVGQVVGYYFDSGGTAHGFLSSGLGPCTSIDYPGAIATFAYGINNSGTIVGAFQPQSFGQMHCFQKLAGAQPMNIDPPGATSCQPTAINDAGQVVGVQCCLNASREFLYYKGQYYFPDSTATSGGLLGVNGDGVVVGNSISGGYFEEALIPTTTSWTGTPKILPNYAGALGTIFNGINNDNSISGKYWKSNTFVPTFGFPYSNSVVFTTFQYPGSGAPSQSSAVNDFNQVVDYYGDSVGSHVFLVTFNP